MQNTTNKTTSDLVYKLYDIGEPKLALRTSLINVKTAWLAWRSTVLRGKMRKHNTRVKEHLRTVDEHVDLVVKTVMDHTTK